MHKDKQESNILDKNIKKYKDIWDKINELAFVMEADEVFVPKCFIDANSKVYSHLGYSKKNFINEMATVTENNSANSENVSLAAEEQAKAIEGLTATAEESSAMSEELTQLVERFKI